MVAIGGPCSGFVINLKPGDIHHEHKGHLYYKYTLLGNDVLIHTDLSPAEAIQLILKSFTIEPIYSRHQE